jgi:hypothetical protein
MQATIDHAASAEAQAIAAAAAHVNIAAYKFGTFADTIDYRIAKFTEFPALSFFRSRCAHGAGIAGSVRVSRNTKNLLSK